MVVAIGTFEMHFPEIHSLKGKRQVIKCLIGRAKAKFNASVAEVGNNELWQRGTIGISMVANDRVLLQKMAQRIEDIISNHDQAQIIDYYWDYI